MRYHTHHVRLLAVAAVLLSFGLYCFSQATQSQAPLGGVPPAPGSTEDVWEAQQRKEMLKKQNLQRQQELKKDAEKLLELATELKQSVDKSNENTLSLDVIRKADQIEKLAKSVKDKMKGP
jgi:hypothetical protein